MKAKFLDYSSESGCDQLDDDLSQQRDNIAVPTILQILQDLGEENVPLGVLN